MRFRRFLPLFPLLIAGMVRESTAETNPFATENNIQWTTLGTNENDSMPIGNGDIAANVWTEQNGDLVVLLAKADAWTELGKLVKLGRVRIKWTPNPFPDSSGFTQTLRLDKGSIEIKKGANTIQIWIDANNPVVHVESQLEKPGTLEATAELWRTKSVEATNTPSPERGGLFEFGDRPLPVKFEPDIVLPASSDRVTWCHFNRTSIYPLTFELQHLKSLLNKYPDPLLHRCFGVTMTGPNLVSSGDKTIKSNKPDQEGRLDIYALTLQDAKSPEAWQTALNGIVSLASKVPIAQARLAHEAWWRDFWNRSWIHVEGSSDAAKVSQGYAMQRWMMACSSRGAQPVKFNGGLFTVGHDISGDRDSTPADHNPDYRQWGNCFWHQNIRLMYWPLVASGDNDLLKPWYDLYFNALPLAKDRTRLYYGHNGAAFVETMHFWGLPNMNDFGWDNKSNLMGSPYMRYHNQSGLEIVAQMLDSYDYTQDAEFARKLVPLAEAIVTFYNSHWPRGKDGKIHITPGQSLETYQVDATNPTPEIAGLRSILPRLAALPPNLTTLQQRSLWAAVLRDLPPIPVGKTASGKLPPLGKGDTSGKLTILPAEKYGKTSNSENPELYITFPYRISGVGKPNLDLARTAFAARLFPQDTCWGQDGTQAAVLGLTKEAQRVVINEFTAYGDQRFSWFWRVNHDWIPDLDNGGSGMITLQLMLMQCDGKRIQLLPAWSSDWNANFKLHAPYGTTVEGHVKNGKLASLTVTPLSRAKDVVVVNQRALQER